MPDVIVIITLSLGALVIQFPIGILLYLDAKRLDLKNPEMYGLGVIVPAGGFAVILYYLSERKTFRRTNPRRHRRLRSSVRGTIRAARWESFTRPEA